MLTPLNRLRINKRKGGSTKSDGCAGCLVNASFRLLKNRQFVVILWLSVIILILLNAIKREDFLTENTQHIIKSNPITKSSDINELSEKSSAYIPANHNKYMIKDQLETDDDVFRPGVPLNGGVIPIRRFVITHVEAYKIQVNSDIVSSVKTCNNSCLTDNDCDGWHLQVGVKCSLYKDRRSKMLTAPHFNRSADSIVGFPQRFAGYFRPPGQEEKDTRKRVLYILHFHHQPLETTYQYILNTLMTKCMPSFMDVVIVTPTAFTLQKLENIKITTLINPLINKAYNAHLTLPIVMAKFPNFAGYLVVNDDAVIRFWKLFNNTNSHGTSYQTVNERWFGERPWGTFPQRGKCEHPNTIKKKRLCNSFSDSLLPSCPWKPAPDYFNGKRPLPLHKVRYDWIWFNFNNGDRHYNPKKKQTNFDGALDAMEDICTDSEMNVWLSGMGFDVNPCTFPGRSHGRAGEEGYRNLMPYVNGKADVFYVPGTELGRRMARFLTIFGEREIYLEISVAMTYFLLVPRELLDEMPLCDLSHGTKKKLQGLYGWTIENCVAMHAIKFSYEEMREYWNKEMEANCANVLTASGKLKLLEGPKIVT